MTQPSLQAHWLVTLCFAHAALIACGNDGSASGLGTAVGGTNAASNGGSSVANQGGGNSLGGAVASNAGGSKAQGGSSSTVGGAGIGGGSNPSAGGAPTSSGGTGSANGGSASGGKASSSAGGASNGGSAAGGKSSGGASTGTGGKASTGGTSAGGTVAASGGKAATGGATTGTGGKAAAGGAASGGSGATNAGSGAPETKPTGYGQATTGGGSVTPKNVASLAEAQAAVDAYSGSGGLVLNYTGKFDFSTITDVCAQYNKAAQILEIKDVSDISIIGADGSSANFGIHIAGLATNIIVRNMTIALTPGGDLSDMISVEGMKDPRIPRNIWIDHNTMYSSMTECAGAGDLEFDGMVDVKKGAEMVTVSYNYMHDHHKVSLNGYTDDDTATRHITFHHNLWENVGSRTPLQRAGLSHIFNNHFLNVTTSGINVRVNGVALIEANYFENVKNPVTSRDSDIIGYWDLRSNNLASAADVATGNAFGITWTSGNAGTVNATDWKTTKTFPEALGYSYTAQPFQCIKSGLRAVVGAGKGLATLKCN